VFFEQEGDGVVTLEAGEAFAGGSRPGAVLSIVCELSWEGGDGWGGVAQPGGSFSTLGQRREKLGRIARGGAVVRSGVASRYFQIGDCKALKLGKGLRIWRLKSEKWGAKKVLKKASRKG